MKAAGCTRHFPSPGRSCPGAGPARDPGGLGKAIRALSLATVLPIVAASATAGETPSLSYAAEHTNTSGVRDIAVWQGRVWAATSGGLSVHDRGDGRFLFALTSIHGLPGNAVNRLAVTRRGTLLAAGEYGVAEIRPGCASASPDCFASVRTASARTFDPVVDVVEGEGEPLLLGHQSGLRPAGETRPAASGGMWRAAARGPGGVLSGGMDGRLTLWKDGASGAREILRLETPVLDLAAAGDGFLVVAGSSLLFLEGGRVRPVLNGARPVAATALSKDGGAILVGTSGGEIFGFRDGELEPHGRVDGAITALRGDGRDVWLGIARKGLVRFDGKERRAGAPLNRPGEICSNHVTRVTTFGGRLIAGTFDNGACVLREGGWEMLPGMEGQYVHGVAGDGESLWVATSNGIARFDAALAPVPPGDGDPKEVRWFAASAVTALAETAEGVVIGSPWGVVRVVRKRDGLRAEFVSRFRGAPGHLTAIAGVPEGLLVASETDGVRFVGKRRRDNRTYLDPVHLPEAWVLDVAPSGTGFWAATCQSGVAFFDGAESVFVREKGGLADDRTVGVAPFAGGAFVATLGGLSYASRDGSARSPFGGALPDPRGSMVSVQGGRLYYGTESGLALLEIAP